MTSSDELLVFLTWGIALIASIAYGAYVNRHRGYLVFTATILLFGLYLMTLRSSLFASFVGTILTLGGLQLASVYVKERLSQARPNSLEIKWQGRPFALSQVTSVLTETLRAISFVPSSARQYSGVSTPEGHPEDQLFRSHALLVHMERFLRIEYVRSSTDEEAAKATLGEIAELIELHLSAAVSLYELRVQQAFGPVDADRSGMVGERLAALRGLIGSLQPELVVSSIAPISDTKFAYPQPS